MALGTTATAEYRTAVVNCRLKQFRPGDNEYWRVSEGCDGQWQAVWHAARLSEAPSYSRHPDDSWNSPGTWTTTSNVQSLPLQWQYHHNCHHSIATTTVWTAGSSSWTWLAGSPLIFFLRVFQNRTTEDKWHGFSRAGCPLAILSSNQQHRSTEGNN